MSVTDFRHVFARRTQVAGGSELATILAGSPPGVGRAGTSEWGVAGIMSFIASTTTKARCRSMDGL